MKYREEGKDLAVAADEASYPESGSEAKMLNC